MDPAFRLNAFPFDGEFAFYLKDDLFIYFLK